MSPWEGVQTIENGAQKGLGGKAADYWTIE